jgi:sugar-specific transcriptional regulator TrmB
MHEIIAAMVQVGLSEYEARAYCALLTGPPANGYQVAQRSGVPRAKVYEALARLVQRGAAVLVDGGRSDAKLYAPTDPRAFLGRIEESVQQACGEALDLLARLQSDRRVVEVLWRVVSRQDLVSRGRRLTGEAAETLHVALWAEEFDALLEDLLAAADRGVRLALILYSRHPGIGRLQQRGAGAVRHSRSKSQSVPILGRQFALVADRRQCITGSIFDEGNVEGVYTLNRGLVTNVVDLVNHEIYVERILQEVGRPVWDRFGRYLGKLDAFGRPADGA